MEKFHVLNNEPLADQLDERLNELKAKSRRWTPEILSLFLLLSDDPLHKTDVESTTNQKKPDALPPLTWKDILAEDPQTEDAIWDEVDFRAGSEDEDDSSLLSLSRRTTETRKSSYTDESSPISAESFILPVHQDKLNELLNAQQSLGDHLTELEIVRYTLQMLLGLPTALYARKSANNQIVVHLPDTIPPFPRPTLLDLLQRMALIGSEVCDLREYSKKRHITPLSQTFFACMSEELKAFDNAVIAIEKSLVDLKSPTVVSLIRLENQVNFLHTRLSYLKVVASSDDILDELFHHVSIAQAIGDTDTFVDVTHTFLRCLRTYLKPLSQWMEEGKFQGQSSSLPFISNNNVDLSSFWQNRYSMVLDENGTPKVPKFLQNVIGQIFASGKSVAYMKELGLAVPILSQQVPDSKVLSFDTICVSNGEGLMLPFSNLLETTLQTWVTNKHHHTWSTLRQYLHRPKDGLVTTLNALDHLYLSVDGSLTTAFHSAVFAKLDAGKSTWRDPFFLEDLARSYFGGHTSVEARKIVRDRSFSLIHGHSKSATSRKDLTVKALSAIASSITYTYPGHLYNIIGPSATLPIYRGVSTLLLQLYRPIYLITQHRLLRVQPQRHGSQSAHTLALQSLTYRLRHTLLNTLTAVRTHLIHASIAPSTTSLHASIRAAASLDDMIAAHTEFITRLEHGCLLVRQVDGVRNAILSLADLGVLFTSLMERWNEHASGQQASGSTSMKRNDVAVDDDINSSDEIDDEDRVSSAAKSGRKNSLSEQDVLVKSKQMLLQHDQLLAFVVAGLQSAARREGGDTSWGVLAEVLEWGLKGKSNA